MTASIGKAITELTSQVTKVNTQLEKEMGEGGDDSELEKMMQALMFMRNNSTSVEYDLDQLNDTLTFMRNNKMGKEVDKLQAKLDGLSETYSTARKATPNVKKALKPLQYAATLKTI
jgi:uncharacterized coiled-coil DUF342 family protein